MADREKVIEGLQELSDHLFHDYQVCYHGDADDYYKRFLQADAALELLKEQQETIASFQGTIRKMNAALAEQPEQKHGRWINRDFGEWKCSACNDSWYLEVGDPEDNEMNYCPMCGAKMDEVKQGGIQ